MSTIKKDILRASSEWAKHLRPWGRQKFWHRERWAERDYIREELRVEPSPTLQKMRDQFREDGQ